jgi:hypothetical protein
MLLHSLLILHQELLYPRNESEEAVLLLYGNNRGKLLGHILPRGLYYFLALLDHDQGKFRVAIDL